MLGRWIEVLNVAAELREIDFADKKGTRRPPMGALYPFSTARRTSGGDAKPYVGGADEERIL
jgi:hypothetical protein